MGGFTHALSEGLEKFTSSELGGKIVDFAGTRGMEYSRSPEGKIARQLMDRGKVAQAQALTRLDESHSVLLKGIQSDPNLRNAFSLDKTPLKNITDHLTKINHPLASVSRNLEAQTADNYTKTLAEIHHVNVGQARLQGIAAGIGAKGENLTPLILALQEHPDPRMQTHALRLLDAISSELKDTTKMRDPQSGALIDISSLKMEVARALKEVNKFKSAQVAKGAKDIKMASPESISLKPTYEAPGKVEKAVGNWIRMVQVPLVAIPHIATYFNLGSAPMAALGRTLLNMGDKEMDSHIQASGILSATMHDIMHQYIEGRTGLVSKAPFAGAPTAGELLYKGMHTPGFNYMREKQLWFGAAVGYHSAIEWAANAASGDKRALAELAEMGIDSRKVIDRGGKLTSEELQKGIFHFTNNRFFVSRLQDQSLKSSSNIFMRSATMYHAFLNSQVSFMRREAYKMIKAGDIKGLAQFAGTLGVLFPAFAPVLKSLEMYGRTLNASTSMQSGEDDYRKLAGQKGGGAAVEEYIDLLMHIGGAGVYMNYLSASQTHRLQAAALGPMFSTPITAVEDMAAASEANKRGKYNINPPLRDVLQDTLPVIGKPLSHWLAPTTKEQPKVRLSRRGKRSF
jgi:hypothetical protein